MSPFYIFYKIHKNIVRSVTYNYGLNYILAGLSTYLIVQTSLDTVWYKFSIEHPLIPRFGFLAVGLGFFLPIIVPICMYLWGFSKKNKRVQIIAFALSQAALLGLGISSLIKVFTGRFPPVAIIGDWIDGGFRFGFLHGGAFNGWPSSHTTIAFSMAVAIIELYPDNKFIKFFALAFASFIGLGVSTNIHWLSDAVAGALIGYAIGKAVGRSFKHI